MPFTQDTFAPVGGQTTIAAAMYSYTTADTVSQVSQSGYFTKKSNQLEPGDWILVSASDGETIFKVSSDTSTASTQNFLTDEQVVVHKPEDLQGELDSTKVYFIDGVIDFTGTGIQIEVPVGGLSLVGHTFDISKLVCSDPNYTLFVSPIGGSGNLLGKDYAIEITGTNSKAYDLVSATGGDAFEFARINYNNCTDLGVIDGYRQGLESGTGRLGGSPKLTLAGTWAGGYFIETSIVRGLDAGMTGALYEAGAGFSMASRFRTNQNIDLPANAAFFDFSPSQFANPSTVQVTGAIVTRNGVSNAEDANITPNMAAGDLSSAWSLNTGMPNTFVGGRSEISAETATTITVQSQFELISGTYSEADLQHFDSPSTGQLRHLGNNPREFRIVLAYAVDGPSNGVVSVRMRKYDNSGASTETVFTAARQINNLIGGRDVSFFNLVESVTLDQNDYIYLEVANETGTQDLTAETGSYFIVEAR